MSKGAPSIVIVGAGIAGLTAALRLKRAGLKVTVLEAAPAAGGAIGTVQIGGHMFERGPNTLLSSATALMTLVDDIGLKPKLRTSRPEAKRRLVWRKGKVHALPSGPGGLLTTPLLSLYGKARLLAEPLIPAPRRPRDETLGAMLTRRLGAEAVNAFVDPFVAGVFTGTPEGLGSDAFPTLRDMEREHGSLFKGLRARAKTGAKRLGGASLVSFEGGLQTLVATLTAELGAELHLGHRVSEITPDGEGWRVESTTPDGPKGFNADQLVIATSCGGAQALLSGIEPAAAALLAAVPTPHVATVGLGYRRDQIPHALDAFGLLCAGDSPVGTNLPVLGVLFVSSIFEDRAPSDHISITVILGGSRHPNVAGMDDAAVVKAAREGLAVLLGARGEPSAVSIVRWPNAIPQYRPGHSTAIATLRTRVNALGNVHLAGNYLDGVGLEQACQSGEDTAAALIGAATV